MANPDTSQPAGAIVPRPFVPLPSTLRHRKSFFAQVIRFIVINLKITLILLKGHS